MMASRCNMQYFQNQRLSLRLLALVSTLMFYFSVKETNAKDFFSGEVGGSVAINCPSVKEKAITFFYFQKDKVIYVNGFYTRRNITTLPWNNTRVDRGRTTVHMYNLTVLHSGDYQCLIQYDNSGNQPIITDIHLTVTARYSKPEVTVSCHDEKYCQAKCTSHGGYPSAKVIWSVPEGQVWEQKDISQTQNQDTKMFNSSSTTFFNCSRPERTSIRCTVGDVTSEEFFVCEHEDPHTSFQPYLIVAVTCVLAIVCITVMVVCCWTCKKRPAGAPAVVRQEWGLNGSEEEELALGKTNKEEEAS